MVNVNDLYKYDFNAQLINELWRIGLSKTVLSLKGLPSKHPFPYNFVKFAILSEKKSNKKRGGANRVEQHLLVLKTLVAIYCHEADTQKRDEAQKKLEQEKLGSSGSTLENSSYHLITHGLKEALKGMLLKKRVKKRAGQNKKRTPSSIQKSQTRFPLKNASIKKQRYIKKSSIIVLSEALINFQNKKQKLMRAVGIVSSFFYAALSSVMNVVAFLGAFSLSVTCTWIFGILMFVTGFQVNFLGSYRVVADMFCKAITYISNGCFWKSVFGYHDKDGNWVDLSKTGKGLLIGGFFASLAASFGTSFLATQSLANILISLHILSAAFPPAWAIVCIATFTLFMTPVLTYAFSALIKGNPLLQVKNFFKKIFSPQDDNKRKNRGFKVFQGICTLALLGLSIFGLWATMSTFNVSMDTMLKGVFNVSKAIAHGVSLGIGIVANFVAQIPFVVETVGRSVSWFFEKINAWFCKSNQNEKQASSLQTSEAANNPPSSRSSSVYEKVRIFFTGIWSAWTWFTKIGSGVGEASIAIDGKDASSYPAAVGQGISAACSASLDEEVDEEKKRIKESLIKKLLPTSPDSQSISNAPRSSTPTERSTRGILSPSNSSESSLNTSQSFFGKEERGPSNSASQSSHSLDNALSPKGPEIVPS